ncbi:hypothetical protein [Pelagibius sp. 7325]|uniref:hypothetical protein n=1 Tax=Pelagibius sp. 7325 TaxID=3131994 RepID=UPI0030EEC024
MSANRRIWIAGAAAFFLVLLPFANFAKTNYGDGSFISINFAWFVLQTVPLVFAGVVALVVLLHLSASRYASHSLSRALITVSGAFFLLFFYHYPYHQLLPETVDEWIPVSLYFVLIAIFAALLFRLARHSGALIAILIFATANFTLALPSLSGTAIEATQTVLFRYANSGNPSVIAAESRPNVYYFILDAYGSSTAIRQNFGYDNSPFIEAMEERGFYHAGEAISSYNRTVFTLASIFAQDYFIADEMTLAEWRQRRLTYPALLNAHVPPSLVADARKQGYEFFLVGNYWAPCAGPWVSCYAEAEGSAYLADVFWSATPSLVISAAARSGDADEVPDVDAMGKLRKRLEESGAPLTPTFTFVHHLSPHAPYLFQADCSLRDEYELDLDGWPESAKPYFLDNLLCANLSAARIADEIIALDPDSIIVFQGDHGSSFTVDWDKPFDEWPPASVQERSSILNLVRLPEACQSWLAPDLDNVTTIQAVMGCASGREPVRNNPRGYLTTFSRENPDHGQVRRIDPTSFRALPKGSENRRAMAKP